MEKPKEIMNLTKYLVKYMRAIKDNDDLTAQFYKGCCVGHLFKEGCSAVEVAEFIEMLPKREE